MQLKPQTTSQKQLVVFWVMTPCSEVAGFQRFGAPYCLHLHGEATLVSYHITTQYHNPKGAFRNVSYHRSQVFSNNKNTHRKGNFR